MLASAHGVSAGGARAETGLLPFLTTDAEPLIIAAKGVVTERLARFPDLGLTPASSTPRTTRSCGWCSAT